MQRAFSLASERSRYKERLEVSVARLCELEMLKHRQEALVLSALSLRDEPQGLMAVLQQQVGELRVDTESSSVKHCIDTGDSGPSSGFFEQNESQSPQDSGSGDLPPRSTFPIGSPSANERSKSNDAFLASRDGLQLSGGRSLVPRSLSAPQSPLTAVTERGGDGQQWLCPVVNGMGEESESSSVDYHQTQRVETYIVGLLQRRLLVARQCKPRTNLAPEARGVVRQSSLCRKEPPFCPEHHKASPSPERPAWASYSLEEEQLPVHYPRPALAGIHATSLDFPCSALDPSSSEADSPQHYQLPHSPSSDEQLVNAQYIPAQPCRAPARAKTHRAHATPKASRGGYSPERSQPKARAAPKKCRFNEEKAASKKPGRKACRSQSENSLLGQRAVPERKYSTVERDSGRPGQPKARRAQGGLGHRRWRSTLELSQDEAEPPPEQVVRRSRRSRPAPPPYPYNQPTHHSHHPHHFHHHHNHGDYRPEGGYKHPEPGEWESSLSEGESPGSSSMSSDSDESGGLVWPQQLAPQLALPSPAAPPGAPLQSKALVKIKASHALKKKILRFRTGSLKVMTTV